MESQEGTEGLAIPGVALGEVIGRGASSVVYRAVQTRFDRLVAVKVLHLPGQSDLVAKLFLNECRTIGHLSPHPNVVSVFDAGFVGSPDGATSHPYLVMEYLPGGTLADRVGAEGPLPVEEVLRIGVQLAGGLHTVHLHDIVHGDIKPQNVLRSRTGEAALADFGIARLASAAGATTRAPLLTPLHAAPELIDGGRMTPRSDVYELCSTLFELLDGDPALGRADESPLIILGRMAREDRRSLDRSRVPDAVADLIESGLASDPSARPGSALELGERLREVQRELDLPVTPLVVMEPLATGHGSGDGPPVDPAGAEGTDGDGGADAVAAAQSAVTLAPPRQRRVPLAGRVAAVVALLAVVGGVIYGVIRESGDGDDVSSAGPAAEAEADTTTSWPDEAIGTPYAGVQPGVEYDVNDARDLSSVVAARLGDPDELLGRLGDGVISYAYPTFTVERLPARFRWQAFNPEHDERCDTIVSWPLTATGVWEKGANWADHQAFVRVVKFATERDAAEAYSIFSLEQGAAGDECTGFVTPPTPFDHDQIDVRHRDVDIGLSDDVRHNTWVGPPPVGVSDATSVTSAIAQFGDTLMLTAVVSRSTPVDPTVIGRLAEEIGRRLGG